mmetsp:Transcript_16215/g.46141  ORF Transcript_16215/g.46141 Transcript_16215/m.46141 type:complete len:364 (+) Transcript_16215:38-1129(+)
MLSSTRAVSTNLAAEMPGGRALAYATAPIEEEHDVLVKNTFLDCAVTAGGLLADAERQPLLCRRGPGRATTWSPSALEATGAIDDDDDGEMESSQARPALARSSTWARASCVSASSCSTADPVDLTSVEELPSAVFIGIASSTPSPCGASSSASSATGVSPACDRDIVAGAVATDTVAAAVAAGVFAVAGGACGTAEGLNRRSSMSVAVGDAAGAASGVARRKAMAAPLRVQEERMKEAAAAAAAEDQQKDESGSECSNRVVLSLVAHLANPPTAAPSRRGQDFGIERGALPSVGSAGHETRDCKPCAFLDSRKGCIAGQNCAYCHLCDQGEKKRRQKEKRKMYSTIKTMHQMTRKSMLFAGA